MSIALSSDIIVEFTLTDGSAALNLALYPGITVYLYQGVDKRILKKYSRVAATGYTLLTVTSESNGKLEIYIPRSITKVADTTTLFAEIKVRKTDGSAESGMFYSIAPAIEIDLMTDTVAPSTDTIP